MPLWGVECGQSCLNLQTLPVPSVAHKPQQLSLTASSALPPLNGKLFVPVMQTVWMQSRRSLVRACVK